MVQKNRGRPCQETWRTAKLFDITKSHIAGRRAGLTLLAQQGVVVIWAATGPCSVIQTGNWSLIPARRLSRSLMFLIQIPKTGQRGHSGQIGRAHSRQHRPKLIRRNRASDRR
jgi:hypothetical protein